MQAYTYSVQVRMYLIGWESTRRDLNFEFSRNANGRGERSAGAAQ